MEESNRGSGTGFGPWKAPGRGRPRGRPRGPGRGGRKIARTESSEPGQAVPAVVEAVPAVVVAVPPTAGPFTAGPSTAGPSTAGPSRPQGGSFRLAVEQLRAGQKKTLSVLKKDPAALAEFMRRQAVKELSLATLPGTPVSSKLSKKRTLPLPGPALSLVPGTPEVLPLSRRRIIPPTRPDLPMATPFRVVARSSSSSSSQSDTVEEPMSPPLTPNAPSPGLFVEVGGSEAGTPTSHRSSVICNDEDDNEELGMDRGSDVAEEGVDSEDECQTDMYSILPEDLNPRLLESIRHMDRENDEALRRHLSPDAAFFDWVEDMTQFRPHREVFTGTPGPTFPVSELQAPVDAFLKIWDNDIVDHIVTETNRYAQDYIASGHSQHSRLKRWKATTREEIYIFFVVRILQSVNPLPVERDYFYNSSPYLEMHRFRDIMSYNRFLLLKKFIHFSDNSSCPENLSLEHRRLYKINPIIRFLNRRFKELYWPEQNIVIDESLLKWFSPLSFLQKIKSKAAKAGIKSYELCESRTGYLWTFKIYAGKDSTSDTTEDVQGLRQDSSTPMIFENPTNDQTDRTENFPTGAVSKIVYDLIRPLLHKGHTLILDNFYNSPLLARCLKQHGTDCFGTLRIDRENLPLSFENINKNTLQPGEVISSTSGDVVVLVWRDTNVVSMISTYHKVEAGAKEKYGTWKYKPQVVLDYNATMGGVDKKDQLLASFPVERKRNSIWYKKLFGRLLNVSVLNAYVIFKNKNPRITHRMFRRQVAEGLLNIFRPVPITPSINQTVRHTRQIGGLNKPRPVLENNHYSEKISDTDYKLQDCVWCKAKYKKRVRTQRKCSVCDVALCIDCMRPYHTGVRLD